MAGAGAGAGAIAANAAAVAAKNDLSPKPLSFWREQEDFLKKQLETNPVPNAANVPGLESNKLPTGQITFIESKFERLSNNTRKMRYRIKELTGDVPSYTQLLEGEQARFYPYFVMIPGELVREAKLAKKDSLQAAWNASGKSSDRTQWAAQKAEFDAVDKFFDNNGEALYNGRYNDILATITYTDKTINKLLHQMQTNVLPSILSLENNGKPLCVYFFHTDKQFLHALAGIFWKKDDIVNAGFYDPLYYTRDKPNDFFIRTIYIAWEFVFREAGVSSKINNLSLFCLQTEKGRHCVQYIMDANYCSIYVFYFFYLYAKDGYPTDLKDIEKVIQKTYVVEDPTLLTRNAYTYTNIFRLTLIHFAMNTILLYTKDPILHVETYDVYNYVRKKTDYRLLTDDMYKIAKRSYAIAKEIGYANSSNNNSNYEGGGKRTRKKTRRLTRRLQKRSRRMRR